MRMDMLNMGNLFNMIIPLLTAQGLPLIQEQLRQTEMYIFIVPEIENFLLQEFHRVGNTEVKVKGADAAEAIIPEARVEFIRDSVSSPRLDSIVSSAFRLSRSKAAEAIRHGIVSVDHVEVIKPDAILSEGAAVTLKGKGKAVLEEIGGESKKGRTRVVIRRLL